MTDLEITNCAFIGINAGVDIKSGDGIVIIGDNVYSLDKDQPDVLFIGDKVAIGKKLFGKPLNLLELILNGGVK
jgi:hypothetical protein